VAVSEAAAAQEPGGPRGPQGPGVSADWLILQRLSDIKEQVDGLRQEVKEQVQEVKEQIGDLRRAQGELRGDMKALDAKVDAKVDGLRHDSLGLWRWSLGLLLVPILGLLAKLLLPGA